ncbi:MAG: nitrilase family protein [Candidatus Azobacteroides sp.]|nr:nitrilase family protein [Candidatus Azobacteroides sp.]
MSILRISLIQRNILWENIEKNLFVCEEKIKELSNKTDLVIFPEMFTTGFTMNSRELAELSDGRTMCRVRKWAADYGFAICGSFIAKENNRFFNRGFFVLPDGSSFFYDKKHLFSPGKENDFFSSGDKPLIVSYKKWNISLLICYDLRFPVWSRNINNGYDLLIYPANWPAVREKVWEILLKARAVENQCYVCGVNRIGKDENGLSYNGNSMVIDYKGAIISNPETDKESIETISLEKELLTGFRDKFPVWKDQDFFVFITDK